MVGFFLSRKQGLLVPSKEAIPNLVAVKPIQAKLRPSTSAE
jgi:hypothetical protein